MKQISGIAIDREGIAETAVEDHWQKLAEAIGCEYIEIVAVRVDGHPYMVVCDEDYHVRGEYRRGDPVTEFDGWDIFGPALVFATGRDGELHSLTGEQRTRLLAVLPARVRRIGEGIA